MTDFAIEPTVIALCQRLIRQPSVSGHEGDVAEVLRSFFTEVRAGTIDVDRYGNLLVTLKGRHPGPTILFDGHIDTVPVPDPSVWIHDPFGGVIDGDRLYGRGATDMKGAVAAMSVAAARYWHDTRGDFAGTIVIAGVVHEEIFEGVAPRLISQNVRPDVVVIGEATHLNLNIGQRGRAEIQLVSHGTSAHSANPEKGYNAIYPMTEAIRRIHALEPVEHPKLGRGILELTDIKSSPYPGTSVVPSLCKATYDRRLLPNETRESVLRPLQSILDRVRHDLPKSHLEVGFAHGEARCYTGAVIASERFFPGWIYDENRWFVQTPLRALRSHGFDAPIAYYSFCTNGSHYAGEAHIPTIGFGPSEESLSHIVDESIELDQLIRAAEGYTHIMRAFTEHKQ